MKIFKWLWLIWVCWSALDAEEQKINQDQVLEYWSSLQEEQLFQFSSLKAFAKDKPKSLYTPVQLKEIIGRIKRQLNDSDSENESLLFELGLAYSISDTQKNEAFYYLNKLQSNQQKSNYFQSVLLVLSYNYFWQKNYSKALQTVHALNKNYQIGKISDFGRILEFDVLWQLGQWNEAVIAIDPILKTPAQTEIYERAVFRQHLVLQKKKIYISAFNQLKPLLKSTQTSDKSKYRVRQLASLSLYEMADKSFQIGILNDQEIGKEAIHILHHLSLVLCSNHKYSESVSLIKQIISNESKQTENGQLAQELLSCLPEFSDTYLELAQFLAIHYPTLPSMKVILEKVASFYYLKGKETNVQSYYRSSALFYGLLIDSSSDISIVDQERYLVSLNNSQQSALAFNKASKLLEKKLSSQDRYQIYVSLLESAEKLYNVPASDEHFAKKSKTFLSVLDDFQKAYPTSQKLVSNNLKASRICFERQESEKGREYLKRNIELATSSDDYKRSVNDLLASYIREKNVKDVLNWSGSLVNHPNTLKFAMQEELIRLYSSALDKQVQYLEQQDQYDEALHLQLEFTKKLPKNPQTITYLRSAFQKAQAHKLHEMVLIICELFEQHHDLTLDMMKSQLDAYLFVGLFTKAAKRTETIALKETNSESRRHLFRQGALLQRQLGNYLQSAQDYEYSCDSSTHDSAYLDCLIESGDTYYEGKSYLKAIELYVSALENSKSTVYHKMKSQIGRYKSYLAMDKKNRTNDSNLKIKEWINSGILNTPPQEPHQKAVFQEASQIVIEEIIERLIQPISISTETQLNQKIVELQSEKKLIDNILTANPDLKLISIKGYEAIYVVYLNLIKLSKQQSEQNRNILERLVNDIDRQVQEWKSQHFKTITQHGVLNKPMVMNEIYYLLQ